MLFTHLGMAEIKISAKLNKCWRECDVLGLLPWFGEVDELITYFRKQVFSYISDHPHSL